MRSTGGSDNWRTPAYLWRWIAERWSPDVDLCASEKDHKCVTWTGDLADFARCGTYIQDAVGFCNPPYSRIAELTPHLLTCLDRGVCRKIVLLIPAGRTEQTWFGDLLDRTTEIVYLSPRVEFENPGPEILPLLPDFPGKPPEFASPNHCSMIMVLERVAGPEKRVTQEVVR